MKQITFLVLAVAVVSGALLTGCGGGGGSDSGSAISRELLAGSTTRSWKLVAIRGNSNYESSGIDSPCAVSLKKLSDPSIYFACGSSDKVVMASSGTFTYRGIGVDWNLSGSTLTLNLGSTLGVLTSSVTVEPVASGAPQRLRLRQISRVVSGVRNTNEDGCELVIEEIAVP